MVRNMKFTLAMICDKNLTGSTPFSTSACSSGDSTMRRKMCGLYGCSKENTNTSGKRLRNSFKPPTWSLRATMSCGTREASLSRLPRSSAVMRPIMESTSMQKVRIADSDTTPLMMKLQYMMFCQCLSTGTLTSALP